MGVGSADQDSAPGGVAAPPRAAMPALRRIDVWCARAEQRPGRWLILLAALLALQVGPLWYATPDGAAYLSMARAVAAGGPVTRLGEAQLGYPLGYALLISPVFRAGPRPLLWLSLAHWLLAIIAMLGVYRWARDQLGPAAPWITALVMVNVNVWILYRRTLSEAAFCALLPWTVTAWNGAVAALTGPAPRRRATLVAGTALAAALLVLLAAIRETGALVGAGVVLAVAAGAWQGRWRWRAAAPLLAGSLVAVLLAVALTRPERLAAAGPAFLGALDGYADAALAAGSFAARLHLRVSELGELLLPGMFKAYGDGWGDVTTALYAPLAGIVAWAWWRLARRGGDVFVWTALPYLACHVAWPYAAGVRYLLPLLPLLWSALWSLAAPLSHRRALGALLVAAHLGVAVGYWLVVDAPRARACHRAWPAVDAIAVRLGTPDAPLAAAAGVPDCVRLMLSLAVDRSVGTADHGAGATWLIAPREAELAAPFAADTIAGDYVLARRRP